MPSRSFVRVGSAAALTLALAIPAGGAIAQDQTTITMLTPFWGIPPDQDLLEQFEAESGIDVQIIGDEGVSMDKLNQDVALGLGTGQAVADVIFLTQEAPSNVVSIGGVEDLTPFVDASGFDLSVFDQVDFWREGEALYGVPVYSQLVMMDYNAATHAEAGFEAAPTTWAEFTEQAQSIKDQGVDEYPISVNPSDWTWYLVALSMGDPMFDDDLNPVFADEGSKAREAMATVLGWFEAGLVSPSILDNSFTQHSNFWEVGSVFHQGWQGSVTRGNLGPDDEGNIRSVQAPNVEYLLLPEESFTWSFPAAIGIGTGSENAEAAWEFIEWYTAPENQEAIFGAFGLYPSRPAVAAALNEAGEIQGYDTIVEQAQYINELPRQALWWGPFTQKVSEEILRAVQQDIPADDVVDTIAEIWEEERSIYE